MQREIVLDIAAAPKANVSTASGSTRVLVLATVSFTLMFAAWLMFGVLGVPIQQEFKLSQTEFGWLAAIAVLNGSLWRLPFGILADRYGGERLLLVLLLLGAMAAWLVGTAATFQQLLVYGCLLGILGNSFSVGISWTSAWFPKDRQGVALGTFGAGNVGASITKLCGPLLIGLIPAGGLFGGLIPGGWRAIPAVYALLLALMAAVVWWFAPAEKRCPGQGRSVGAMLAPLKQSRVWCLGLYYVVVFGAYVALCMWLPAYYMRVYGLSLGSAAALSALFVFPASLLRPVGGWLSDRFGANTVTYGIFVGMLLACLPLALPTAAQSMDAGVTVFTLLVLVIGICMGVGKAAAFKHIADDFPKDIGAVGGLVGTLGALGGVVLPPLCGYLEGTTRRPQVVFAVLLVLIAVSFLWLHLATRRVPAASTSLAALHQAPQS